MSIKCKHTGASSEWNQSDPSSIQKKYKCVALNIYTYSITVLLPCRLVPVGSNVVLHFIKTDFFMVFRRKMFLEMLVLYLKMHLRDY